MAEVLDHRKEALRLVGVHGDTVQEQCADPEKHNGNFIIINSFVVAGTV